MFEIQRLNGLLEDIDISHISCDGIQDNLESLLKECEAIEMHSTKLEAIQLKYETVIDPRTNLLQLQQAIKEDTLDMDRISECLKACQKFQPDFGSFGNEMSETAEKLLQQSQIEALMLEYVHSAIAITTVPLESIQRRHPVDLRRLNNDIAIMQQTAY